MAKNTQIPLKSDKAIKSFSSYKLTEEEGAEILKYKISHKTNPFMEN